MTLDKNYDYIEDKGDHYLVASLIVNDSLEIDLDKRLHVTTHVYIAGDLSAGTIVAGGNIVVKGAVMVDELQADLINLSDKVSVKHNIVGKTAIQIGKGAIGGSMISSGKIYLLGNTGIGENISAKDMIIAKSGLSVTGNIAVGSLLDVSGLLLCDGEVRVLGKTIGSYGRLNGFIYTIVIMDNIMLMTKSSTITHAIESIDDYEAEVENAKEVKEGSREFEFAERKGWIRNIANPILKIGSVG